MISFFPDLNVWLALSVAGHSHSMAAWQWLNQVHGETALIFCRYTQVGLLRLLTNESVMGEQTLTVDKAWRVYDRWLKDPRVVLYPEPKGMDSAFRQATTPFARQRVTKSIGDCYLLAFAGESKAALVTFDRGLLQTAKRQGFSAISPG